MAELRADGERVLVTAGASGIGRVIAETLSDAGAKIHICDIDQAGSARSVRRGLKSGQQLPTLRMISKWTAYFTM